MNKITCAQLSAMLLITDIFTLFCLTGELSPVTAAGYAAGAAVQLIMALPLAAVYKNEGKLGSAAKIVCLAYLLLWGGELFIMLWNAADAIFIPPENWGGTWGRLLTAGMIAAVCIYASSEGLKPLARASVIAAALGAVCLLVIMISAVFSSDWKNLTLTSSSRGLIGDFMHFFVLSGGLGSFVLLLGQTKGKPLAVSAVYFTAKAVAAVTVVITAVLVTGGIMELTDFPVITSAQISQPFSAQRIDALFLIIFAIFAVFAVAVQTSAAVDVLSGWISKFRLLQSAAVIVVMLGAAFLLVHSKYSEAILAVLAAAVLTVIPAIQLAVNKTGGGK